MIRGFVAGVFWGGVVAAFGLAVASQIGVPVGQGEPVMPQANAPTAAAPPAAPAEPGPADLAPADPAPSDPAPAGTAPSPAPVAPVQPATPAPVDESSLPVPDAAPATKPEAEGESVPRDPAAPGPGSPDTEPLAEASETVPVVPDSAETAADDAAPSGAALPATAEPSPPADDLAPPPGSEFARPLPDVDPLLPAPEAEVPSGTTPAVAEPAIVPQPLPDTASAARPDPALAPPDSPEAPAAVAEPATLPQVEPVAEAPVDPAQPDAPAAEAAPGGADLPPPPPLGPEEQARLTDAPDPATDTPPAADGDPPAVVTGELPRIGDAPANDTEAGDTPAGDVPGEAIPLDPADDTRPPLQRFARPFENPSGKPLFAVLLLDTSGPDVDRIALAELPFPVSFVIDPLAPDAGTAAAIYRAAGQEVLMLGTGIPDGATAADLEVTFATHAAVLPEAVAVIDTGAGAFQGNAQLAGQVATLVKAQGRGLMTYEGGLNPADQVARREGLPSATVFRRLDAEGEAGPAIRRYLDRAAFKAAQEGRVAVIGNTRPETVAALLEWSVEGRASSVALAPATAVLAVR